MPIDYPPLPEQIYAEPVSAFMKGRAMRMAYEQDKLQSDFLRMQMQEAPRRAEFERQKAVAEWQAQQQEKQQQEALRRATASRDQLLAIENSADPVRDLQTLSQATGMGGVIRPGTPPEEVRSSVRTMRMRLEAMAGLSPVEQDNKRGSADETPYLTPVMDSTGELLFPDPRNATFVRTGVMGQKSLQGYETRAAGEGIVTSAKESAKLNVQQKGIIAQSAWTFSKARGKLLRIRQIVARMSDKTGITAELLALLDPELQELRAIARDQMMDNMNAARAAGVAFGQVTEAEWRNLAQVGFNLSNRKSANLAIIDRLLSEMDISIREARDRFETEDPAFSLPPLDDEQENDWEEVQR